MPGSRPISPRIKSLREDRRTTFCPLQAGVAIRAGLGRQFEVQRRSEPPGLADRDFQLRDGTLHDGVVQVAIANHQPLAPI